jgi:hypothetical protein
LPDVASHAATSASVLNQSPPSFCARSAPLNAAFRPADQVGRLRDLDAPLAKCWIDRRRFDMEASAAARYG